MNLALLILSCLIFECLGMAIAWSVAKKINNYSIVDALWALSFPVLALPIYFFSPGYDHRKLIFGGLFLLWGLRLGGYLMKRILSHLHEEDGRYQDMRKSFGDHIEARFFSFYQFQAVSVILLLGPLFIVSQNEDALIHPIEWVGVAIWILGLIGESVADHQMASFKKDKSNRGKICEKGLWYYSRHPNYFFEAVMWFAYGIFSLGSPHGVAVLYAPLIMWFLLLKVTGVPYAETQNLKSKGDLYRHYQKTTSIFIPLPKRKA
jgi:steroid 5-alpha reductase family enzyme